MDLRKVQDTSRSFGPVPTAVWSAFRKQLPWQQDPETRCLSFRFSPGQEDVSRHWRSQFRGVHWLRPTMNPA
jgi:hypothetical protein